MKYERLAGALEEEMLKQSLPHFQPGPGKTMADVIREHYGFSGYSYGRYKGTLTRTAIQLELHDDEHGVRYTRTYKPEEWLQKARDAARAHQMSLFELMENDKEEGA